MLNPKNAIIIHGWGADSQSNWFPWLAKELSKHGFSVQVPNFPNTNFPKLPEWLKFFKENVTINKDTILISHSLGVPFILRLLEKLPKSQKIKAAFLVSGFERPLGFTETKNFVDKPFNWTKIRESCEKFVIIHSDNDPYVPLSIGKDLAKSLGVEPIIEHAAGHINAPGGYLSYPKLLSLISEI